MAHASHDSPASRCFLKKTAVTGQENVFLGFRGRKRYSECHGDPVFPSLRNRFVFYESETRVDRDSWSRSSASVRDEKLIRDRGYRFTPCLVIRGKDLITQIYLPRKAISTCSTVTLVRGMKTFGPFLFLWFDLT